MLVGKGGDPVSRVVLAHGIEVVAPRGGAVSGGSAADRPSKAEPSVPFHDRRASRGFR